MNAAPQTDILSDPDTTLDGLNLSHAAEPARRQGKEVSSSKVLQYPHTERRRRKSLEHKLLESKFFRFKLVSLIVAAVLVFLLVGSWVNLQLVEGELIELTSKSRTLQQDLDTMTTQFHALQARLQNQ